MYSIIRKSIHLQVLIALSFLTVMIIGISIGIQNIQFHASRVVEEKNRADRLNDSVAEIRRNSEIYQLNAARDYESYYRDLEVYYKVTINQLDSISQQVNDLKLTNSLLEDIEASTISVVSLNDISELESLIQSTTTSWNEFKKGLSEKFGDNHDEPRLEWGAKYIVENVSGVASLLSGLTEKFETLNRQQVEVSNVAVKIGNFSLIVFVLLFLLFFYTRIINPIEQTKRAFLRVSNGDFGHQIESFHNNEIGELVSSFNEMSSRSDTVLSILSELQSTRNINEAVSILQTRLHAYTGCDLVSLLAEDSRTDSFKFRNVAPVREFKNLFHVKVSLKNQAEKDFMTEFVRYESPIHMSNIHNYLQLNRNAVAFQALIKRYPLKSVIAVPIVIADRRFILLFASYFESRLQEKHMDLILNLLPFIKHKFISLIR